MPRLLRLSFVLGFGAALALGASACKSKNQNDAKFDADAKSGPDGARSGARVVRTNFPVTDEVSYKGQDKTDWYHVELKGKPGILTCVLKWDSGESDVAVDVFDDLGKQLSASAPKAKGAKEKQLLTQIDRPGHYFVRVSAPTEKDATQYTLEARWEEPKPENIAIAIVEPPPEEPKLKPKKEPKEPVEKPEAPTNSIQGRIVAAYRDDSGNYVLQIDKGSSHGIKVGMSGVVLNGPGGEDAVEGGELKVFQIVGPAKSLARSGIKSLGKNNRVSITLK
jgi:hypothetical protein